MTQTALVNPDQLCDEAAEAGLCSSMIIDASQIPAIRQVVSAQDFANEGIRLIFEGICDTYEKVGNDIDAVLIRDQMKSNGTLDRAGGIQFFVDVMGSVPNAESWRYYVDIIRKYSRLRGRVNVIHEAMNIISNGHDPEEKIALVDEVLSRVHNDEGPGPLGLQNITLDQIESKVVQWLWNNRIPAGMLSLICGNPGAGKSFLVSYIVAQVTMGRNWVDCKNTIPPSKVLLFADEDPPDTVLKPRLDWQNADTSKVILCKGVGRVDGINVLHIQHDVSSLEKTLDQNEDLKLIIFDPITAYMEGIDGNNNTEVRSALIGLQALAERRNITIIGISHLSKKADLDTIHRVLGSIGFVAAARSVWGVVRDPVTKSRLLMPVKTNCCIDPTSLEFNIVNGQVCFSPAAIDRDIDEVVQRRPSGRASRRPDDAVEWLQSFLEKYPEGTSRESVEAAGKEKGFSERQIRSASERLEIIKEPAEFGGKWYWKLSKFSEDL